MQIGVTAEFAFSMDVCVVFSVKSKKGGEKKTTREKRERRSAVLVDGAV